MPDAKATAVGAVDKIVENAVDQADKEAGAGRLFASDDKTLRKRGCDVLTAQMVAGVYGVPADELKQIKIMGCVYTWKKDGQIVDAKVMMIRAHKTLDAAKTWFGNVTATKTGEQLAAEMDMVRDEVKQRQELDTDLKKKTAVDMAALAKMAMPEGGITYGDATGIGDEARISNADGVMWVRLGNLTFQVAGYHGPEQPRIQVDPKNLKGMAKAAMEAQKKWHAETLDQRRADVKKLAPLVVKAFEAL